MSTSKIHCPGKCINLRYIYWTLGHPSPFKSNLLRMIINKNMHIVDVQKTCSGEPRHLSPSGFNLYEWSYINAYRLMSFKKIKRELTILTSKMRLFAPLKSWYIQNDDFKLFAKPYEVSASPSFYFSRRFLYPFHSSRIFAHPWSSTIVCFVASSIFLEGCYLNWLSSRRFHLPLSILTILLSPEGFSSPHTGEYPFSTVATKWIQNSDVKNI